MLSISQQDEGISYGQVEALMKLLSNGPSSSSSRDSSGWGNNNSNSSGWHANAADSGGWRDSSGGWYSGPSHEASSNNAQGSWSSSSLGWGSGGGHSSSNDNAGTYNGWEDSSGNNSDRGNSGNGGWGNSGSRDGWCNNDINYRSSDSRNDYWRDNRDNDTWNDRRSGDRVSFLHLFVPSTTDSLLQTPKLQDLMRAFNKLLDKEDRRGSRRSEDEMFGWEGRR